MLGYGTFFCWPEQVMGVLSTFLVAILLIAQAKALEELDKDGILCLSENQEKTALARWLHCLQDAEADLFDIVEEPAAEHFLQPQEPWQLANSTGIVVAAENPFLADYNGIVVAEDLRSAESEDEKVDVPVTEENDADDDQLETECLIPPPESCQLADSKRIAVYENQLFADGEENKLQLIEECDVNDGQAESTRSGKEDALLNWVKLNVAILIFSKLLLGLFKSKMVDRKSSEPMAKFFSEDRLEGVPEISKSVIFADRPSTSQMVTGNLQMLGGSLGSAVGALFSEVLMKSYSSGSAMSADKICMILEAALKDLFSQFQDDDCCSRVLEDFLNSFKSTYTTAYRIRQACASYAFPEITQTDLERDIGCSTVMSSCQSRERKLGTTTSCTIVTDIEDKACQAKDQLSAQHLNAMNEQPEMKLSRGPTVHTLPEVAVSKNPSMPRDQESTCLAESAFDLHEFASGVEMDLSNLPCDGGKEDAFEDTLLCGRTELSDEHATHLDYLVEDSSSVCEEPPDIMESSAMGMLNKPLWKGQSHDANFLESQNTFLKFYQRHVRAQEQHNQFKYTKLQHLIKQQTLEEEKIQLAAAANGLMRENIDLGRYKANFKEGEALQQQTRAAHLSFCATCADELAAGLCVMLTALVYSVRKYSFVLLNDLVSMCQPIVKEPRRSAGFHIDWFYGFLDSFAGKLQSIVCHFAVTGRILLGSVLVAVVAQALLRRSVANSSQAMPATILIIVLGGVCGFIGKVSVDSLGGSGNQWWLVWGIFCLLHALANCFTPSIYRFLHGSAKRPKSTFSPPYWARRLAFHLFLVLFLPLLAGLLPFGTFSCIWSDLSHTILKSLADAFASVSVWIAQTF